MICINNLSQIAKAAKLLPKTEVLSRFVTKQKQRIMDILHCLIVYNLSYKDIKVNHCLLNTWDDKFIHSGVNDNMLYCNFNHTERLSYTADIYENNQENDLHTI